TRRVNSDNVNRIASRYDGPMLTSHLHQIIIEVIGQCLKRIEFYFLSQGRLHALSPLSLPGIARRVIPQFFYLKRQKLPTSISRTSSAARLLTRDGSTRRPRVSRPRRMPEPRTQKAAVRHCHFVHDAWRHRRGRLVGYSVVPLSWIVMLS